MVTACTSKIYIKNIFFVFMVFKLSKIRLLSLVRHYRGYNSKSKSADEIFACKLLSATCTFHLFLQDWNLVNSPVMAKYRKSSGIIKRTRSISALPKHCTKLLQSRSLPADLQNRISFRAVLPPQRDYYEPFGRGEICPQSRFAMRDDLW